MPKRPALALGLALALSVHSAPIVAQEPAEPAATPAPICGLLAPGEVAQAMGVELPISSSYDTSCSWDDFASGGTSSLNLSIMPGRLSDIASAYADATSTEVAGHQSIVGPDGTYLFAQVDDSILSLFVFTLGESAAQDLPAGMRMLAERAIERLPSIELPVPPTPAPQPSFVGDAELAALFPLTVAGQPLEVQTFTATELFGEVEPDDVDGQAQLQAINDLLAAQGRTLQDVSLGFGFFATDQTSGGLTAVRVRGADIRALLDGFLPLITEISDLQRVPVQIAGRDVIQVTEGPDGPDAERQFAYPKDEVLWVIRAEEPALSELIGQLP